MNLLKEYFKNNSFVLEEADNEFKSFIRNLSGFQLQVRIYENNYIDILLLQNVFKKEKKFFIYGVFCNDRVIEEHIILLLNQFMNINILVTNCFDRKFMHPRSSNRSFVYNRYTPDKIYLEDDKLIVFFDIPNLFRKCDVIKIVNEKTLKSISQSEYCLSKNCEKIKENLYKYVFVDYTKNKEAVKNFDDLDNLGLSLMYNLHPEY